VIPDVFFYCSGWDDRAIKNLSGVAWSGRWGRGGGGEHKWLRPQYH